MNVIDEMRSRLIPHVAFQMMDGTLGVGREIASTLAKQLCSAYCIAHTRRNWTIVHWRIDAGFHEERFVLILRQYRNGQWAWLISPIAFASDSEVNASRLFDLCRGVHTALQRTDNVTSVRWSLKSLASRTEAVATPDELDWRQANIG